MRLLFKLVREDGLPRVTAAANAGMSERSARRYLRAGKTPTQMIKPRQYRTRPDAFADVWEEITCILERDPRLEVRALFVALQQRYPGRFAPGQLRTLQRRVKAWRATDGSPKEVFSIRCTSLGNAPNRTSPV